MESIKTDGLKIYYSFDFSKGEKCLVAGRNSLRAKAVFNGKMMETSCHVSADPGEGKSCGTEVYCSENLINAVLVHHCCTSAFDDDTFFLTRNRDAECLAFLHPYRWILSPSAGLVYIAYYRLSGKRASFIIDWASLRQDERQAVSEQMEHMTSDKFLVVDSSSHDAWRNLPCIEFSDEEVLHEASSASIFSFIMKAVRKEKMSLPKDFVEKLLSTVTPDESLEDMKTLTEAGGGISVTSRQLYNVGWRKCRSLLDIAAEEAMNDDVLEYLIRNGCLFSDSSSLFWLASELYDTMDFSRVLVAALKAGYCFSLSELFDGIESFISFSANFDYLLGRDYIATHDTDSDQCCVDLDQVRCRQFAQMSPYLPDELFSFRDCNGDTLLSIAANELGRFRVLENLFRMILDRTPDVNFMNESGLTALDAAADGSFIQMLKLRGAVSGVPVDYGFNKAEARDLYYMPSKADHKLFSMIIGSASDKSAAIRLVQEPETRETLCTKAIDRNGLTVFMNLMGSTDPFNPELCDALLSAGYDVNQTGINGENALFSAVYSPDDTCEKMEYLIHAKANAMQINRFGETVLHKAAKLFHMRKTEWDLLMDICALADDSLFTHRDCDGKTPVMVAFDFMHMDAVNALMLHGHVLPEDLDYIKEKASVIAALQLREKLSSLFRPYGGIDFKFERHPNAFQ